MNAEYTNSMSIQFMIFIVLLITFNLIIFSLIEKFPFGSYQRSETYGRLIPRARDRDEIVNEDEDNAKDDKNSVDAIQKIDTDLDSGNYKWNGNINFPYGGFIYERSYPVYAAPNVCEPDTPYYSTLEGKCIAIDNAPAAYETINSMIL
jgi:hypothetical protein